MSTSGLSLVRSAILLDHVGGLEEVAHQLREAAFTSLRQVVACHHLLRRERRNRHAILDLESVLDHLRERNCVAAAARSLIFYRAEEVKAADISPIEIVRNLVVRDF